MRKDEPRAIFVLPHSHLHIQYAPALGLLTSNSKTVNFPNFCPVKSIILLIFFIFLSLNKNTEDLFFRIYLKNSFILLTSLGLAFNYSASSGEKLNPSAVKDKNFTDLWVPSASSISAGVLTPRPFL